MTRPVAEWVALYQAGASLRAIGAEYGCCHKTVRSALKRAGEQIRRDQPHTRARAKFGWCDECCTEKQLNDLTGWCERCTVALGTARTLTSEGASIA